MRQGSRRALDGARRRPLSQKVRILIVWALTGRLGVRIPRSSAAAGGTSGPAGLVSVLSGDVIGWMIRLRLDDPPFLSLGCFSVGRLGPVVLDREG